MGRKVTAIPRTAEITLSGFVSGKSPTALSLNDRRVSSAGASENVLGAYMRCNVVLAPADPPYPTARVEYKLPNNDLLFVQPGPAIVVAWNRLLIFSHAAELDTEGLEIDPLAAVPPGTFWTYRTTVGNKVEQRLRLGSTPQPGDIVLAILYWRDFTL